MSKEAMKLALEALKDAAKHLHPAYKQNEAIKALQEALAKQEQGEPVAWMYVNEDGECEDIGYGKTYLSHLEGCTPLYITSQPKQKQNCEYCDGTGDVHDFSGEWRGICICEAGKALKQLNQLTKLKNNRLSELPVSRLGTNGDKTHEN